MTFCCIRIDVRLFSIVIITRLTVNLLKRYKTKHRPVPKHFLQILVHLTRHKLSKKNSQYLVLSVKLSIHSRIIGDLFVSYLRSETSLNSHKKNPTLRLDAITDATTEN